MYRGSLFQPTYRASQLNVPDISSINIGAIGDTLGKIGDQAEKRQIIADEKARQGRLDAMRQDQWDKTYALQQDQNTRAQATADRQAQEYNRGLTQRELLAGANPVVEQRLREANAPIQYATEQALQKTKMGAAAKEYSDWYSNNRNVLNTPEGQSKAQAKFNELLGKHGLTSEQGAQMSRNIGQQAADMGIKLASKTDAAKAYMNYLMNTGKFTPEEATKQADIMSKNYMDVAALQKDQDERIKDYNTAQNARVKNLLTAAKLQGGAGVGSSTGLKGKDSSLIDAAMKFKDGTIGMTDANQDALDWADTKRDAISKNMPTFARYSRDEQNRVLSYLMQSGADINRFTDTGTYTFKGSKADEALKQMTPAEMDSIAKGNTGANSYLSAANNILSSGIKEGTSIPTQRRQQLIQEMLNSGGGLDKVTPSGNTATPISTPTNQVTPTQTVAPRNVIENISSPANFTSQPMDPLLRGNSASRYGYGQNTPLSIDQLQQMLDYLQKTE